MVETISFFINNFVATTFFNFITEYFGSNHFKCIFSFSSIVSSEIQFNYRSIPRSCPRVNCVCDWTQIKFRCPIEESKQKEKNM